MNNLKRTPYFLILALLVAGCFSISPAAKAGGTSSGSSEEVSRLLSQVMTEAIALDRDSETLASWTGATRASWHSHASKLAEIRDHVNRGGDLLTELNQARQGASAWQHEAIDRIYPLLKELADNTEATINHLNDSQANIHFSAYREYAKTGADLAHELAVLVSDYVELGETEAEFQRLQDKLNTASASR